MIPFPARVDLGPMAMKEYSAFPKAQHHWNLTVRLFGIIYRTLVIRGSYLSAEVQSVYSTALADLAIKYLCISMNENKRIAIVFNWIILR